MYETHFGFHRQPFQSADATRAFFVSESIHSILPQLLHALRTDLGIAVVTGQPGSGRTALLRHIQHQLALEGRAILCSGAAISTSADLTAVLLEASRMKAGINGLNLTPKQTSRTDSVSRSFAIEEMKRTAEFWGPVLLLIDDAQFMTLPILNELRSYTEEEWNGRGLVHCLISAPISFEEQLVRPDYAEFGRRIRCHAFLQPLKSDESMRLLKEQIELAGGKLNHVFTPTALELIVSAANGTPRCLSLLADESLVVAAEASEAQATETSVRTALGRLQHLSYSWNASPISNSAEEADAEASFESEPVEVPKISRTAAAFPNADDANTKVNQTPVRKSQTPVHTTLAPGVVEFGGPSERPVYSIPEDAGQPATPVAEPGTAAEPPAFPAEVVISAKANPESSGMAPSGDKTPQFSSTERASTSGAIEFGGPHASRKDTASFEVGHRFTDESPKDSISFEEVDDDQITGLFNYGDTVNESPEYAPERAARMQEDRNSSPREQADDDQYLTELDSEYDECDYEYSAHNEQPIEVMWINGNDNGDSQSEVNETSFDYIEELISRASNNTDERDSDSSVLDEITPSKVDSAYSDSSAYDDSAAPEVDHDIADSPSDLASSEEHNNHSSDINSSNIYEESSQSSRSVPVTYTSRPSATNQFLNRTESGLSNRRPVFDRYTWIALGRDVPPGTTIKSSSRTNPLIQDDYVLLAERERKLSGISPAVGRYVFDEIKINVTTDASLMSKFVRNSKCSESGSFLLAGKPAPLAIDSSTLTNDDDTPLPSVVTDRKTVPGLKLWQDGQLIFGETSQTDVTNSGEVMTSNESADTENSPAEDLFTDERKNLTVRPSDSAKQTDATAEQGISEFYTVPASADIPTRLPMPAGAEHHDEASPVIDSIANIRSDMQRFRRDEALPEMNSSGIHNASQANLHHAEKDNLIARAERRLKSEPSAEAAPFAQSQAKQVARIRNDMDSEAMHEEPTATSSPAANSPQFSRLFTRLWETRKQNAHLTEKTAGTE